MDEENYFYDTDENYDMYDFDDEDENDYPENMEPIPFTQMEVDAIITFRNVTGVNEDAAIGHLKCANWNYNRAVNNFFLDKLPDLYEVPVVPRTPPEDLVFPLPPHSNRNTLRTHLLYRRVRRTLNEEEFLEGVLRQMRNPPPPLFCSSSPRGPPRYIPPILPQDDHEAQAMTMLNVNAELPVTVIKIRLYDGKILKIQLNYHHSVSVIKSYIKIACPEYSASAFELVQAFPVKDLDDNDTVESARLFNCVLFQKMSIIF